PFSTWTSAAIQLWSWTGSIQKSRVEIKRLIALLASPLFSKEEVKVLDFDVETAKLDQHFASSSRDGWRPASVSISVPDGKPHASEADAPTYIVDGLWYRPLTQVIKA
ncbi:hypothetical protein GGX14DRAFT_340258, partial [Mycena pura]